MGLNIRDTLPLLLALLGCFVRSTWALNNGVGRTPAMGVRLDSSCHSRACTPAAVSSLMITGKFACYLFKDQTLKHYNTQKVHTILAFRSGTVGTSSGLSNTSGILAYTNAQFRHSHCLRAGLPPRCDIDERIIKEVSDVIVSSGLRAAGWVGWQSAASCFVIHDRSPAPVF